MAHIQSRSHGNESPLGSVTPFSVYQSICLLQLERLATLTVAWRLLPSLHPNVHTSSSQSVQPNTVEMRYLRQQFQVAAVSQVPKSLSLAGSVYVWFSKSGTAKSMVSTCLLAYTQNEPAVCPLLWFPVAPKLRPMSSQIDQQRYLCQPIREPLTLRHFDFD